MTTKRIAQLVLGLTITAFIAGCGNSKTDSGNKDAARDTADARPVSDTLPSDPPLADLGDGPLSGDAPRADTGLPDGESVKDAGPDGVVPMSDTQPGLDVPAADAPADAAPIDTPADRARSSEAGDVSPVCTAGSTEACASPGNPLIGACHAGTRTCVGGVWSACSETLPAAAELCNGIDDNCNGLIDEGCEAGCIVVCGNCSNSSDGGSANGSVEYPFASVEAAIAAAGQNDAGTRQRICLVGGPTCRELTLYPTTGSLKVPDGLIIQGSYALGDTGLTYCGTAGVRPRTTLSFAANEGVVFDQTVVQGVELSSLNIEINPSSGSGTEADTVSAIAIKGGKNVTLSRVYVAEGFSAANTRGVSVTSGGQATITGSNISTGQGRNSAVGLYVNDGTVTMRNNCDKLVNGRCESNCFDGGAQQGIHGYLPADLADAPVQASGAYVVAGNVSLVGTMLCGGTTSMADGQSLASVATLRCEGSGCTSITGNVIVGGTDRNALAVALVGATPVLDSNHIYGGCGSQSTTGLRLEGSSARLQNNQILAGNCPSTDVGVFRGLQLVANGAAVNPDIHSNTIEPLGVSTDCQSVGVEVTLAAGASAAISGVLRNNIVSAGECRTRFAINEAASTSLKSLQNNDLYAPQVAGAPASTILYRHGSTDATTAAQVNAITLAAANISANPQYSAYPDDFHLTADSACIDTGTSAGAPTSDADTNPRPAGDGFDLGAYELSM